MEVNTNYFGKVPYTDEEVIHFPEGLFGFEHQHDYLPIAFEHDSDKMICLQSIHDDSLSFILMNPFYLNLDYIPVLSKDDYLLLKNPGEEELSYYVICVIRDSIEKSTVNLKSPIVVNIRNRYAKQIILDNSDYTFRQPLGELLVKGD